MGLALSNGGIPAVRGRAERNPLKDTGKDLWRQKRRLRGPREGSWKQRRKAFRGGHRRQRRVR